MLFGRFFFLVAPVLALFNKLRRTVHVPVRDADVAETPLSSEWVVGVGLGSYTSISTGPASQG